MNKIHKHPLAQRLPFLDSNLNPLAQRLLFQDSTYIWVYTPPPQWALRLP